MQPLTQPAGCRPRRNKDRLEYCLCRLSWRSFAEALKLQPGDCLAFQLVQPGQLHVTCLPRPKRPSQDEQRSPRRKRR